MLVVANPTVWKCLFQLANTLFCDLCVVDGEFFKRRKFAEVLESLVCDLWVVEGEVFKCLKS